MPLWSNTNSAAGAPKYKILSTNPANGSVLFTNTTIAAFGSNEAEGVFDYNAANTLIGAQGIHAGWVLNKIQTGYVASIVPNAAGTLYSNADYVTLSGVGVTSAVANVVTNGAGAITSLVVTNPGNGIANLAQLTTTFTTATGSGATLTITLGGRAGRTLHETLVAGGSNA